MSTLTLQSQIYSFLDANVERLFGISIDQWMEYQIVAGHAEPSHKDAHIKSTTSVLAMRKAFRVRGKRSLIYTPQFRISLDEREMRTLVVMDMIQ